MATKRALLIGINYIGTQYQLNGCVDDIKNMKAFLLKRGYNEQNIVMMSDDKTITTNPLLFPTKNNIILNLYNMIKQTVSNDTLFFHYSGHGTQMKDKRAKTIEDVETIEEFVEVPVIGGDTSIIDEIIQDIKEEVSNVLGLSQKKDVVDDDDDTVSMISEDENDDEDEECDDVEKSVITPKEDVVDVTDPTPFTTTSDTSKLFTVDKINDLLNLIGKLTSGDEKDGIDECIVSADLDAIQDDIMKNILIQSNDGAKIRIVTDSCFSASNMDLPFMYKPKNDLSHKMVKFDKEKKDPLYFKDIIHISGCKDNQTSADAYINNEYQGALTSAFLDVWSGDYDPKNIRWKDLINLIDYIVRSNRFKQVPCLSASQAGLFERVVDLDY
jgi:hypothetical protein